MSYLTQGKIADDASMRVRVASCAAQEGCAQAGIDPDTWTWEWRRVWSSAPGWDAAWESAEANNNPNPGVDPAVITDSEILSQVQSMKPFERLSS